MINWDAIGALGELIGSLAVLVTLLYLAVQIKEVRKNTTLTGIASINQAFIEIGNTVSASPELARIKDKARQGLEPLERWEREMLNNHLVSFLNALETADVHLRLHFHVFEESGHPDFVEYFCSLPGAKECWDEFSPLFGGRLSEEIGRRLADHTADT